MYLPGVRRPEVAITLFIYGIIYPLKIKDEDYLLYFLVPYASLKILLSYDHFAHQFWLETIFKGTSMMKLPGVKLQYFVFNLVPRIDQTA